MGLVLLCVIWLITFASTYFFIAKTWWFPHGASASTAALDHQFVVEGFHDVSGAWRPEAFGSRERNARLRPAASALRRGVVRAD